MAATCPWQEHAQQWQLAKIYGNQLRSSVHVVKLNLIHAMLMQIGSPGQQTQSLRWPL